jgi:hypothetical protein
MDAPRQIAGCMLFCDRITFTKHVELIDDRKRQFKNPEGLENLGRSDLRAALLWITEYNLRTTIVAILFLFAGIASLLGYLRWQHFLLRMSFALLCWVILFLIIFFRQRQLKNMPNEQGQV